MRTFILSATAAAALFATALSAQAMTRTDAQMKKYCPEHTNIINCSFPRQTVQSNDHMQAKAYALPSVRREKRNNDFWHRDASQCFGDGLLDCPL